MKEKITVIKSFVSDKLSENSEIQAYASWKIGNKSHDTQTHPLHLGSLSKAKETPSITIDNFVKENNIQRIDLIKIDTDGHELEVLKGASESIKKFKPYIIMEAGLYILKENNINFTDFFNLFKDTGCKFMDMKTKKTISSENYQNRIPEKSTTDILISF